MIGVGAFVALVVAGIFAGISYEMGKVARFVFKNNTVVTVLVDFVVACFAGFLFVGASFLFCDFILSGFSFIAFFTGLFLERSTLGFLLAKKIQSVYNWLTNLKNKFAQTRMGKRIFK